MLHITKCNSSVCFELERNAAHANTKTEILREILLLGRCRFNEGQLDAKYRKIVPDHGRLVVFVIVPTDDEC